jgi:drug/metabolite transporter (DMT)-like permease
MTALSWLYLFASSGGFAVGGIFLKRYADLGTLPDLAVAFSVFAISNLLYAHILAKGLGQGAVLSSVSHMVLMSAAGVLLFGERMNPVQLTGLVFAVISVWMVAYSGHLSQA